jgi:hypothetical protein
MHDINLINLIDLINNVLQPQNSGHLSSTLIEKLENLRENLKHGIIPEHFDEKYFSFDISNPRQMTETERNLTQILALLPKIKPKIKHSKLYLKNKRSNKREKRRCSRAKIKSNKKCRKHSRRPHCIPKF